MTRHAPPTAPRPRRPRAPGLASGLAFALGALAPTGDAVAQAPAPGAEAFPSDSAVLAILRERVEQKRSAGMVVGLLEPDGSTRILAWGDPGPGRPPLDGSSVFEIGSITKVFTATILADMAQAGEVSLDDPVARWLPDRVEVPSRNGTEITLGSLSEQNSGLPRMPTNFRPADAGNPYADYTVEQLYDFLSGYTLPRDPGAQFEYSNLGVGLLGHVLALRADTSYEALVRARILAPLGMDHTAITLTPWMRDHLALGHGVHGEVVSNWDVGVLAGAGGLRSTAVDMLKFLDANLHPERGPLQRAMDVAHRRRAEAGVTSIGLNWIRTATEGDTIVWHNGGTGGYRAFAGIVPSRKVGVVVLTNSTGEGADDVGMHLLDPSLPLRPAPQPVEQFSEIELPRETLARYVGTYALSPQFEIEVTLEGDELWTRATGQGRIRIHAYSERDFYAEGVDAQLTFESDGSGRVTRLVLHQNGRDVPGEKIR